MNYVVDIKLQNLMCVRGIKQKTGHETGKDVLLTFLKFPATLTLLCQFRQQERKRQQLTRIRLHKRRWHFADWLIKCRV
jgi:hypothetical protein